MEEIDLPVYLSGYCAFNDRMQKVSDIDHGDSLINKGWCVDDIIDTKKCRCFGKNGFTACWSIEEWKRWWNSHSYKWINCGVGFSHYADIPGFMPGELVDFSSQSQGILMILFLAIIKWFPLFAINVTPLRRIFDYLVVSGWISSALFTPRNVSNIKEKDRSFFIVRSALSWWKRYRRALVGFGFIYRSCAGNYLCLTTRHRRLHGYKALLPAGEIASIRCRCGND